MTFDLLTKPEPLHPELQPFVRPGPFGDMIHHKLIVEIMFMKDRCAYINRRYEYKKEELNKRLKAKDFTRWVFLHERPYRFQAFQDIIDQLDQPQFESLLADVWIDSENAHEFVDDWHKLWERIDNTLFDSEEAQKQFQAFPDRLSICRGTSGDNDEWLSWTLDLKVATKFAKRGNGKVVYGWIDKSKVKAYYTGRGEEEIVALIEDVDQE